MRIVDGFLLKTIADQRVVVPLGTNTVSFRSIITLNDTGAFLWEQLQSDNTEEGLVKALLSEYDVDERTARSDVAEFIKKLTDSNLLV